MIKSCFKAGIEFIAMIVFCEGVAIAFQYTTEFNNILKEYRGYTFFFLCFYVVFRGIIVDAERRSQKRDMNKMFVQTLQKYDNETK